MEVDKELVKNLFEKYGNNFNTERIYTFYLLLAKNGLDKLKKVYVNKSNFDSYLSILLDLGLNITEEKDIDSYKDTKTFNFDWLRYFLAFAELKSTAKAAEKLSITPQAIVKGISNIEKYYGIKLINRKKHFTELTNEGHIFKVKAESIMKNLQEIEETFSKEKDDFEDFNIVYTYSWQYDILENIFIYLKNIKGLRVNFFKISEDKKRENNVSTDLIFINSRNSFIGDEFEYYNFEKSPCVIAGNKDLIRKNENPCFFMENLIGEHSEYVRILEKLYVPEKYFRRVSGVSDIDTCITLCQRGFGYAYLPKISIAKQLKEKNLEIIEEFDDSYNIYQTVAIRKSISKNIKSNIIKALDDFRLNWLN